MFYRRNKMGVVAQLINFFSFHSLSEVHNNELQSVEDCMNYFQKRGIDIQLRTILAIIKKFEHEGFLLKIGQKGDDPIYGGTYLAQTIDSRYLEYGSYDFYYHGFSSIRKHFLQSVLPIDVRKKDGSQDIGTCFVIDAHRLLTARHCIEDMNSVRIMDPYRQVVKPKVIWVPADGKDIALIEMDNYNFSSVPNIKIEHGNVMDEILTMGYPPIPGFDAINIADLAHVGAAIRVSGGRIVGEERTLFDPEAYFLINAKVKGGNSGGPIINNLGFATGMIVNVSLDPNDREKLDHLAYGIAVTGVQLNRFISQVNAKSDKVINLPVKITEAGFSTFL